ncbi:MAG: molybdenum cofactor biosysynthesis protein [Bdellovibrionales bacterium GWA2_49_15]|nr:MAG: molybdenum cofactor biosysynthesis protein [Bdellovibrionales bacterium GWA2_49_15]HAZ13023.1 MOSC domain-containing protein [Bdellovibrionales bacterium]
MSAKVTAVSGSSTYSFSKKNLTSIFLLEGVGVEGDVHAGKTVKHRSKMARNPSEPNLRQVHLIHAELHDELRVQGFHVTAGQMGENITTRGVDLLNLPAGTQLHLGESAVVELTGLRDPCKQIDGLQKGLMAATLGKDENGKVIRKAGVMGIVLKSGEVRPEDEVKIIWPEKPFRPLELV